MNATSTCSSAFDARCDRAAGHDRASSQPRSHLKRVKTATRGRSAFCRSIRETAVGTATRYMSKVSGVGRFPERIALDVYENQRTPPRDRSGLRSLRWRTFWRLSGLSDSGGKSPRMARRRTSGSLDVVERDSRVIGEWRGRLVWLARAVGEIERRVGPALLRLTF